MKPKRRSRLPLTIAGALIAAAATIIGAFITIGPDLCSFLPCPDAGLSVRVANEQNEPIQGAQVLLFYSEGAVRSYSDSAGIATIFYEGRLDNAKLVVEAENYEIFDQQLTKSVSKNIDIRLQTKQGSEGKILFRLLDQETIKPVPNTNFDVFIGADRYHEVTDSSGIAKFTFPFPPSGRLDIKVAVQTSDFEISNHIVTVSPENVQDILLNKAEQKLELTTVQTLPQANESPENAMVVASRETLTTDKGVEIQYITSDRVDSATGFQVDQEQVTIDGISGEIRVLLVSPDGKPLGRINTNVFTQKTDVNDSPLVDRYIKRSTGDEGGVASIQIEPGTYAVESEIKGYPWNALIYNHEISSDQRTTFLIVPSQLAITIHKADNTLVKGSYVSVNTQKPDVNSNPVPDQRISDGRINDTGEILFTLTPGYYSIIIDGLHGENWGGGNSYVPPATLVRYNIRLGQIRIEARDEAGEPLRGYYTRVNYSQLNINNQLIPGQKIMDSRTDDTGASIYDLTPGTYFVVSEQGQYQVVLEAGQSVVVKSSDLD